MLVWYISSFGRSQEFYLVPNVPCNGIASSLAWELKAKKDIKETLNLIYSNHTLTTFVIMKWWSNPWVIMLKQKSWKWCCIQKVCGLVPVFRASPNRLAIYLFPFSTTNAPALHLRVALMMVNYHVENSHQSDIIKWHQKRGWRALLTVITRYVRRDSSLLALAWRISGTWLARVYLRTS